MRDFNDADRQKKKGRINLPENPDNLSQEALQDLETAVRGAARDGYVPCPSAWRIAADAGISRLAVGAMIDRLGLRITDCQLGCFKVSKTAHTGTVKEPFTEEIARRVAALGEKGEFTCTAAAALARELKVKPMAVAEAANVQKYKIKQCQLGCF
ncbi:hypothetical protein [Geotalea toluenoxydans]|uniref:hypothetical protein n=1 Tax=Geotalea toluenoxydans TaxID=421624 RepID=UPI0006CF9755|nr:hypothetical protein [Geotalea toluenoxydans]